MTDLTHPPAQIIAKLMVSLGLVTSASNDPLQTWPVYRASEPNTPDDVVTVYDDVGTEDGRILRSGEVIGQFGIMVRVRSSTDSAGYLKIHAIRQSFAEDVYRALETLDSSSYRIHSINKLMSVVRHGKELPSSRRHTFSFTCITLLEKLS